MAMRNGMAKWSCVPVGMCSWNYLVRGADVGEAEVVLRWNREEGSIRLDVRRALIAKDNAFTGRWTLVENGAALARGVKPSALRRRFAISAGTLSLMVTPSSVVGRGFALEVGAEKVGSIEPVHPFTRRATLRCDPAVPEMVRLFALWLVVVAWRRAASSS